MSVGFPSANPLKIGTFTAKSWKGAKGIPTKATWKNSLIESQ